MVNKDFIKELERKSDYSIALVAEIASDIDKLNQYPSSILTNKLDEVNKKIDYAREQWINVNVLDKQLLDFRVISFWKDVDRKISDVNKMWNSFNTNLDRIETKYEKLKLEKDIDQDILAKKMENLKLIVLKAKLLLKVKDIALSWWNSVYNLEEIQSEYLEIKDKWINVDDIEEILFEI